MKIAFVSLVLATIAVVIVAGCPVTDYSDSPDAAQLSWQEKYCQIDPAQLSDEQKQSAIDFDDCYTGSEENLKFIGNFPWLDANNLSPKDKVFLVETSQELVRAMFTAGGGQ